MKAPIIVKFSKLFGVNLEVVGNREAFKVVQSHLMNLGFYKEYNGKKMPLGLSAALYGRVEAFLNVETQAA